MTETQKNPQNLLSHYQELQDLGYIFRLQQIIDQISTTPRGLQSPIIYANNLKAILSLLTDKAFKIRRPISRDLLQDLKQLRPLVPPRRQSTSPQKTILNKSIRSSYSTKSLIKSFKLVPSSSYAALKNQRRKQQNFSNSLNYISDFSNIRGPATFFRSERKLNNYKTFSPGPAAYSPKQDSFHKKSPRPTIPNGGKRFDFQNHHTPSPMTYYPRIHFVSK